MYKEPEANITMLSTATYAPVDVGLNLDNKHATQR
jgi:hypothetical protein